MASLARGMAKLARRIGAAVLLVCVLAPLLACLFDVSAAAQSSLPACCRTHGKHQCLQPADQGTQVTNVHAKCPCMPGVVPPGGHQDVSLQGLSYAFAALIPLVRLQGDTSPWMGAHPDDATHERGPPSVLFA